MHFLNSTCHTMKFHNRYHINLECFDNSKQDPMNCNCGVPGHTHRHLRIYNALIWSIYHIKLSNFLKNLVLTFQTVKDYLLPIVLRYRYTMQKNWLRSQDLYLVPTYIIEVMKGKLVYNLFLTTEEGRVFLGRYISSKIFQCSTYIF